MTKYNIGDIINGHEVVGILSSDLYALMFNGADFSNLYASDSKWREKRIYAVKLPVPSKQMTIEDLQRLNPNKDYCDIVNMHEALPLYHYMWLIEANLDSLKEQEVK